MFDQILDTYRRAVESTLQLQQAVLGNWTQQWPQLLGTANPGAAWLDQVQDAQMKWAETVPDMLNKHREMLDAQYRAGIRAIEDVLRVGGSKDPAQFRQLTEELWKQSFESLRTMAEAQMRDVEAAMQKLFQGARAVPSGRGDIAGGGGGVSSGG